MRSFFGLVKREPRTFIQIAEGVLVVLANDHVAIFHEVVEECANNRFHRRVRPGDNGVVTIVHGSNSDFCRRQVVERTH